MLENKKLSDREILYQFLRRIPIQNRTIAHDIVNRDSNEKQVFKVPDNNVKDVTTPALNTSQKRDANAGDRTLVRTLTRMGCNPYANHFSEVVSCCVFERFVIFPFRKNYLAFYVQKLGQMDQLSPCRLGPINR